MATVYSSAIALALRLITKKGEKGVTLREYKEGTANPTKPWKPTAAVVPTRTLKCNAVFLDFDLKGAEPKRFADGTEVRQGDKQVYLAASGLDFAPDLNNILVRLDGTEWRVGNLKSLDPDGTPIVYELWCKK